jgi:hypothetical protein
MELFELWWLTIEYDCILKKINYYINYFGTPLNCIPFAINAFNVFLTLLIKLLHFFFNW